jgi:hypothetical protein
MPVMLGTEADDARCSGTAFRGTPVHPAATIPSEINANAAATDRIDFD